jgi:L-glutamine---4-(methylsulfanyl)-2-oxobutanoate aminotransferase
MPEINKNLSNFTESVIRRMTRIALKYNAINLSQGFPDFDPPAELLQTLKNISMKGPHQYAITWGASNFREALSVKQSKYMKIPVNPDENIVVTCGSTEAMMVAMMTVCNKGDKVIVFSPFYENYSADAILSGAEPIYVPLNPPDFSFDPEVLENAFKQKPKAIILCNPSNPTGKVFSLEELTLIAGFSKKYDTFVITDEVYEHIIYKPYKHTYIASLPDMFERTISCSSLSKTYSITGWRLGYIIASPEIINEAKKIHDFLTVGAAAPLQEAAVTALNFPETYYDDLQRKYTEMKTLFLNGLSKIGLKYSNPQGAYYVMVDIKEFGMKNDIEFCEWMTEKIGVAAVPGSSFFRENIHNYIRFHFAKKPQTLNAALERLGKLK